MTASALTPDQIRARLSAIRHRIERSRDDVWQHELNADGDRIMVRRAVFGSDGKRAGFEAATALCSFGPGATTFEKQLVRDTVEDLGFLLDLLTDAGRQIRDLRGSLASRAEGAPAGRATTRDGRSPLRPAPGSDDAERPNYAAEAAMKCNEASFQAYLRERHGTEDDGDLSDSATAAAVQRRALKIGARSELNTDPEASARWREMRADFQAWGR